MAKSKKDVAVATLKKEIHKHKKKIHKVMRKAKPHHRKEMRLMIKRLDLAVAAISLVFDDKSCLPAFDDNCTFND